MSQADTLGSESPNSHAWNLVILGFMYTMSAFHLWLYVLGFTRFHLLCSLLGFIYSAHLGACPRYQRHAELSAHRVFSCDDSRLPAPCTRCQRQADIFTLLILRLHCPLNSPGISSLLRRTFRRTCLPMGVHYEVFIFQALCLCRPCLAQSVS